MEQVTVKITERPNTCTVTYKGRTHTCRWRNEEVVTNVIGDECLLKAALTAWDGPNEFVLTADELKERSGGWWSP